MVSAHRMWNHEKNQPYAQCKQQLSLPGAHLSTLLTLCLLSANVTLLTVKDSNMPRLQNMGIRYHLCPRCISVVSFIFQAGVDKAGICAVLFVAGDLYHDCNSSSSFSFDCVFNPFKCADLSEGISSAPPTCLSQGTVFTATRYLL